MNPSASNHPIATLRTADLPPGPMTTGELTAVVSGPDHARYRRLWHGMYRHEDQPDDLRLRSLALARSRPDGVLCGRSAALLWGDDTAPEGMLPEIWLPVAGRSRPGRVYRSGAMPSGSVTEVEGVRLTTPLRTCRDLAAALSVEDAAVAIERMCTRNPPLAELVRAVVAHPAGRIDAPLRRVAAVLDPRSTSIDETRARAVLASAGFDRFDHGHMVRLGRSRVELPLSDPALRCAVFVQPTSGPRRTCDEPTSRELRRAGWTLVMVRMVGSVAVSLAGGSDVEGVEGVTRTLRSRWPATRVREPLDVAPAADPHGIWAS